MGAVLFLRPHSFLPLFSLLTLLQFPSELSALSITCENSGEPIFIPLGDDFSLRCNYETENPVFAIRLDRPSRQGLAQIVFTTNSNSSKVPGLSIYTAAENSIILDFKNFTKAQFDSDYMLTIFNNAFQQYQEKIDIRLLSLPIPSALSITCEHAGGPIFIPLRANFALRCTYQSEPDIIAIRLDRPSSQALAQIVFTTNHTSSKFPGLTIKRAAENSIILSFKNFTEALYHSDYMLTIINNAFEQNQETIDIRRAEVPVISLDTDNADIGFVDWAEVTNFEVQLEERLATTVPCYLDIICRPAKPLLFPKYSF